MKVFTLMPLCFSLCRWVLTRSLVRGCCPTKMSKTYGAKLLTCLEHISSELLEHVQGVRPYVLWGGWCRNERHLLTVLIILEIGKVIKDQLDILEEVEGR